MRPVFVSYAREDSKLALRLAADLKARRADVWIDQLDIQPGQQWDREVERALRECRELLVVLSPHSVESNNVMDEISFALDEGKVVIPVVAADCQIPFRLRRRQYIDIRTDYESGVQSLVVTIAQRGQIPPSPDAPAAEPVPPPDPAPVRPEPTPIVEVQPPPAPKPPSVISVKKPSRMGSVVLLWAARLITAGGALLALSLLNKHSSGGTYFFVSVLFLLLSVAQFVSWKWTRPGLAFSVLMVLCLLAMGSDANFGSAEYIIVFICVSPSLLLFIRSRINK